MNKKWLAFVNVFSTCLFLCIYVENDEDAVEPCLVKECPSEASSSESATTHNVQSVVTIDPATLPDLLEREDALVNLKTKTSIPSIVISVDESSTDTDSET